MQQTQTRWRATASELAAAVKACTLSIPQIAKQAGVNYHCVYRIKRDGIVNQSQNAVKLCKFFNIRHAVPREKITAADLKNAVVEIWDGTAEQGRLIIELMRLAGSFQSAAKRNARE